MYDLLLRPRASNPPRIRACVHAMPACHLAEVLWYGDEEVIDIWLAELVRQRPRRQLQQGSGFGGTLFASFQGLFKRGAAAAN